jgi:hypothetical protein
MVRNRERRGKLGGVATKSQHMIEVRGNGRVLRPKWLYSAQATAERTVLGFMIGAALLSAGTVTVAATRGDGWLIVACSSVLAWSIATTSGSLASYLRVSRGLPGATR